MSVPTPLYTERNEADGMSDAIEELEFWERRSGASSGTNALREEMQAFLADHPPRVDLEELRDETSGGDDLSALVEEGREERV